MARSAAPANPKRPRGRPPVAAAHPLTDGAELLTIKEVADYFRLSIDTISRMIHGTEDTPPQLDSVRVMGSIRIPREAVKAYIAANKTVGGSTAVSQATRSRMGMR